MTTIHLEDFPKELRRQAESRAALEGITLRDLIVLAITNYLESPITLDVKEVIVGRKDSSEDED